MAHAEFFPGLLADFVKLLRVFERTYRERCCEKVKAVFLCVPGGPFKPQPEAGKAPLAALPDMLKTFDRGIKLLRLAFHFNKRYGIFCRQSGNKLFLFGNPAFIFPGRKKVRVVVKHGDFKILRQIFKAVAAARSAAGMEQQRRHNAVFFVLFNYFFKLFLEITVRLHKAYPPEFPPRQKQGRRRDAFCSTQQFFLPARRFPFPFRQDREAAGRL